MACLSAAVGNVRTVCGALLPVSYTHLSRLMGIAPEAIIEALKTFSGARRRFETKGKAKGIWIVDDYAHHPTEIGATLNAAKASEMCIRDRGKGDGEQTACAGQLVWPAAGG